MTHGTTRRSLLLLGGAALASTVAGCNRAGNSTAANWMEPGGKVPGTKPSPSPSPSPSPVGDPVHVSLLNGDGDVRGVGMPIIAFFNAKLTDAKAFNAATKITANGSPVQGNWYFEETAREGAAMEAHWRPETYWPAHAKIHMDLPVKGVSAGTGLYFDDSLTLDMSTGTAYIGTIDASTLRMTVTADGAQFGTFPVSLGATNTPTSRGVKVIMEKGLDIPMRGPGYYDPHVQFTQRLTYGGEYLHSAPWNVANIGHRSSSNGCTNLLPADAQRLYNTFEIGDVFTYPNANGPAMTIGMGYGDWNVPWSEWQTGGALQI
ncbi:L,D-transpeptidase [Rugosimonospora africana]|uniref:L,D-transpeptidase n=1 Tax=Rugosimonospora africana TaxID=556532 RepID=UPI0019435E52|nr:L,D-transpeptidase [Rugosimonospora africana]